MQRAWFLFAPVAVQLLAAPLGAACVGDCSGDGLVTPAELVVGVNVALGRRPIADCAAIDRDSSRSVSVDELLGAVNSSVVACPIFPSDYRETFVEVRGCRSSIEHGLVHVRVLASPDAVRPYLDGANPLPVGSVIIKEEFDGSDCDDRDFTRWRVMRKEEPGFDAEDGDWHWQWVEPNLAVRVDRKDDPDPRLNCINCHVRPACLARDYMCTEGEEGDLQVILQELPAALLSVAGTSATDVYAVGADPDDGKGPFVVHYDGTGWTRLESGASGNLWWISVTPIDGSFYLSGDGGLILEYDLQTQQFRRYDTPGDALLYGIWGPSENDLWAVGDDKSIDNPRGVIWHFDGVEWSVVDTSLIREGGVPVLFKVWGRSAAEVYAVGQEGVILLFNGEGWTEVESPTSRLLFTVHGNEEIVAGSGGFIDSVIVEREEGGFVTRPTQGIPQLNGIFIAPDGGGAAVGIGRSIAYRRDGDWSLHDSVRGDERDYHATWIDPEGGVWAVGGVLTVDPSGRGLDHGLLSYAGRRVVGRELGDEEN